MLAHVQDTMAGLRDRALLLIGFAVALHVEDIVYVPEGLVLTVRVSKGDQERAGQKVAVVLGNVAETCPVRSLRAWLLAAGIGSGPLFRGINQWADAGRTAKR